MDDEEVLERTDDDEVFCEGDMPLEDIDVEATRLLQTRLDDVMTRPEGDARNMAMLGVLHEMYGEELVVL